MSKRNALLVAIVAAIVLAAFFFWPERARAMAACGGVADAHLGSDGLKVEGSRRIADGIAR